MSRMSENSITDQDICNEMVTKIAKLAKLRLTKAEVEGYQDDFKGLLEMFHALDELAIDVDNQPERVFIDAEECREDEIKEIDGSGLKKASPYYNSDTSYFDVPQFIGNEDD